MIPSVVEVVVVMDNHCVKIQVEEDHKDSVQAFYTDFLVCQVKEMSYEPQRHLTAAGKVVVDILVVAPQANGSFDYLQWVAQNQAAVGCLVAQAALECSVVVVVEIVRLVVL